MAAKTPLREAIETALQAMPGQPFAEGARGLLNTLGYASERRIAIGDSTPEGFRDFLLSLTSNKTFDEGKALFADWKSADLLFQLTDEELAGSLSLFHDTAVNPGLLRSYLFFAIELTGGDYARGKLTNLARQLNRIFPMPVMALIKHTADKRPALSIAVINRRQNKRDAEKDVLGKVTIIRNISLEAPHRGHLDILDSFALPNLVHPQRHPIDNFDALHAAWEEIFNVELLNKRFYRELANWYFWALPQVEFPDDLEPDDEKRRATGLIRLLTRLIFCWFLKEKGLIPETLFHPTGLAKLLKGFDPESETSSTYYLAILQNLFFATLNQRMGKDGKGNPYRFFAADEGFPKNRATYDVNNLYRYEKLFAVPQEEALALFADIPFLNGGLFECLDRTEDGTNKKRYLDGFSRNPKKRPHVPDRLFFDSGETADLSEVYGDKKRKKEQVTGLITILNRYKFTIVENTPIDQEIALDPELLGKVFENLLASYNEETKTTARKQTGSFYTPRPIVDYMVDESLKAHLTRALVEKARMKEPDARAGLDILFAYTEREHAFTPAEVATLVTAIDEVKILDPACGSGAFPMGVLHKLVYILGKLDPDNERWKQTQLAKLDSAPMREALEAAFKDNNDDYGRKLYLIENCLYGVDIQPIAIQITKLRFFISLVCDQKTNRDKAKNHGIRPLPNLETKFVAANSLIGLPIPEPDLFLQSLIEPIEKEIEAAYHGHFTIQRRDQKLALQNKIKTLRQKLADTLLDGLGASKGSEVAKKAQHLADWDPFNPQASAGFFDPHWMFGRNLRDGFDVIIGNPPYIPIESMTETEKRTYEATYPELSRKYDSSVIFILAGLRLLCDSGVVSYISSVTWQTGENFSEIRRTIIRQSGIRLLVNLPFDMFESAYVDTGVYMLSRKSTPKYQLFRFPKSVETFSMEDLPMESVEVNLIQPPEFKIVLNPFAARLVCRIRKTVAHKNLGEISKSTQGLAGNRFNKTAQAANGNVFEFVESGQVYRYTLSVLSTFNTDMSDKRSLIPFYETGPKLLIRRVINRQDRLMATLCDKRLVFKKDVNPFRITDAHFSPQYVLALLNSRIVSWLYVNSSAIATKDDFRQTTLAELRRLPIPTASDTDKNTLSELVDQIMAAKHANPTADTSDLEREIDQRVYALYGLTPEEIAIVEGRGK